MILVLYFICNCWFEISLRNVLLDKFNIEYVFVFFMIIFVDSLFLIEIFFFYVYCNLNVVLMN